MNTNEGWKSYYGAMPVIEAIKLSDDRFEIRYKITDGSTIKLTQTKRQLDRLTQLHFAEIKPGTPALRKTLIAFKFFGVFLPPSSRDDFELALEDLEADIAEMQEQNCSRFRISKFVLWNVFRTICASATHEVWERIVKLLSFLHRSL